MTYTPKPEKHTEMAVEGLTATLNMPPKLESRTDSQGREYKHALPPYKEINAYLQGEVNKGMRRR